MRYTVKPQRVCPSSLSFDLDGDVVRNIEFVDGCNGNLKAISKLEIGPAAAEIAIPTFRLRKLLGLIGTGFAQPNPVKTKATEPMRSRCVKGLIFNLP